MSYGLTHREIEQLDVLVRYYRVSHADKNYALSDQLRAELIEWGAWPPEHGWHPVFESPEHRQARLAARRVSLTTDN